MKSKQRFLWLHAHFLNWMGGHKFIYEVVQRLNKNYQVDIFNAVSSDSAKRQFKDQGILLKDLSTKSTNDPLYWLFLQDQIKKEQALIAKNLADYDLVISSHFPYNYIASQFDKPHIYCCWEPYAFFHDPNYIKGFNLPQQLFIKTMGLLYKNLDLQGTKKADKIITLSEFNKGWIEQIYGRSDSIISYEGVDTDFFKKTNNRRLQQQYQGHKIILHSTDFTAIKGTDYLIKALTEVIKKLPQTKLLITHTLANPDKKQKVEKLAAQLGVLGQIEFLGRLEYDLLPAYYTLADVVVQPSINQSMSLSVKEAMACSTPVVTSLEGYEQTKDGEAGLLVDPKDRLALAAAIIQILSNPSLADKMGSRGRRIILSRFSWEAVTKVFDRTIKELCR